MKLFKTYKSLAGYLHRFTLLSIGQLHIRTHRILKPDATPFLHTHLFSYISIILKGGIDQTTPPIMKVGTDN